MAKRLKVLSKVRIPAKNPYYGLINVFEDAVLVASRTTLQKVGREAAGRVKDTIERQLYQWKPLSPRYAAHKRKMNLDPRILIATGDYIAGIGIRKLANGQIEVGVKKRIHKPSGLPLRILAKIHEFGTRKYKVKLPQGGVAWVRIPARPHWRPVIAQVRAEIGQTQAEIRKVVANRIARWVKKKNKMKSLTFK
jgi:hypothetical protein